MLSEDPVIIIRDLLDNNWTTGNTVLANKPDIHTGWYDYGSSDPQVTVTNPEESTVGGGETGHTAGTGAGGVSQIRAGTVLVNCWAGTREDTKGAGSGGSDVNPKEAAYDMAGEVHRIAQANATGTTDSNGNRQLNSLGADPVRRVVDTEKDPVVYRYEATVKFTYGERT